VSASHAARSTSAPQGSGVTHTPVTQCAPGEQEDARVRHSQPAAAAHDGWLSFEPHTSLTVATGTA
jgi:hypothetical protein